MFKELEDQYNDIIKEAERIIEKYKTPNVCKNEQELNELEDAESILINDAIAHRVIK